MQEVFHKAGLGAYIGPAPGPSSTGARVHTTPRSLKMNLKKLTCRGLIVSMLALSFQTAGAGMIGADQAAPSTAPTDRTTVLEVLARADTASRLQTLGVDPAAARDRVAAMSDQEVSQLASDIRTAPAGADGGTVAAVIIIAAAIWYFAFRR
jgi:hypothetical protein